MKLCWVLMKNTKLGTMEVDEKGDMVPVLKEHCRLMEEAE